MFYFIKIICLEITAVDLNSRSIYLSKKNPDVEELENRNANVLLATNGIYNHPSGYYTYSSPIATNS